MIPKGDFGKILLSLVLILSLLMNVGIVNAAQKENASYGSSAKATKTIPVKGITVSPSYASVIISDTIYLSPNVTPSNATNKSVTWSSSNSNVARVYSTGAVVVVGAGTARITAKAGNYSASCTVTVTRKVPVTGITVSPTSASVYISDTVKLSPNVTPSNATD